MSVPSSKIHNLPPQPTLFIGREQEITEIVALLQDETCRLLTLVGAGGIGKTRLSIEVASRQNDSFSDGVFFVALAPLSAPDNIVTSIANAISLHIGGEGTPQEQLIEYLQDRNLLLVLDNFEHLLDGVEIVTDILYTSTHVKILATSREALNLQEEWVRHITGMRFPDAETVESIEPYSALKLFMERVHRIRGDFDDLGCAIRICQLVGGMPLAIEMATAWLKVMPGDKIIQEIRRNIDFLMTKSHNIDERHRSIRAVFDQSWKLLSEDEQRVLSKLSVFQGGFELEAAVKVAGASLFILAELVEKSLLRITSSGRYEFHELLRQYAQQRLGITGEIEAIRDSHSTYYLHFMAEREHDIKGRRQFEGLDEIEADFENVRTAWICAIQRHKHDDLNKAIECLDWFCAYYERWQEGRELFHFARQNLSLSAGDIAHPVWGRIVARDEGYRGFEPYEQSQAQIEQCLQIAKQDENRLEVAYCLNALGNVAIRIAGDHSTALEYWGKALALFTELHDSNYVAWLHYRMGIGYGAMKQGREFSKFVRLGIKQMREKGDQIGLYVIVTAIDSGLWNSKNIDYKSYNEEFKTVISKVGGKHAREYQDVEKCIQYFFSGDFDKASELGTEVLERSTNFTNPTGKAMLQSRTSIMLGLMSCIQEDYVVATHIFEKIQADELSDYPASLDPKVELGFAIIAVGQGEYEGARRHLQVGLTFAFDSQQFIATNWYLPVASLIMMIESKLEQAVALLGFAYHYAPNTTGWLDKWQLLKRVRADLEAELGVDVFASAWERGKNSDLDETVIRLLAWLNDETPSEATTIDHANKRLIEPLTLRELEVIQLIVSGLDNREISDKLFISIPTVKKHINHIFGKLDVNTRAKAIVRARDLHLDS